MPSLQPSVRTLSPTIDHLLGSFCHDQHYLLARLPAVDNRDVSVVYSFGHLRRHVLPVRKTYKSPTLCPRGYQTQAPVEIGFRFVESGINWTHSSAKYFGELLGKFRREQIRLEDGIKCISDELEHAEGAYTTLATNAD